MFCDAKDGVRTRLLQSVEIPTLPRTARTLGQDGRFVKIGRVPTVSGRECDHSRVGAVGYAGPSDSTGTRAERICGHADATPRSR